MTSTSITAAIDQETSMTSDQDDQGDEKDDLTNDIPSEHQGTENVIRPQFLQKTRRAFFFATGSEIKRIRK